VIDTLSSRGRKILGGVNEESKGDQH